MDFLRTEIKTWEQFEWLKKDEIKLKKKERRKYENMRIFALFTSCGWLEIYWVWEWEREKLKMFWEKNEDERCEWLLTESERTFCEKNIWMWLMDGKKMIWYDIRYDKMNVELISFSCYFVYDSDLITQHFWKILREKKRGTESIRESARNTCVGV